MTAPSAATVQQLADYLAWQVGIGNGALRVRIDRRGLAGLSPDYNLCTGIRPGLRAATAGGQAKGDTRARGLPDYFLVSPRG